MQTFHVQVWQAKVPDFLARHLDFFPACNVYSHVADLKVQARDVQGAVRCAFQASQHGLDESSPDWTQAEAVTLLHDASARSTSVGDILVVNGEAHGVHPVGFKVIVKKGREQRTAC